MDSFDKLGLPDILLRSLAKINFTNPTPIQSAAIPVALKGRDILGSAQTGTGKTGAFGLPLLAHLIKNPKSTAIVMSPTRELAAQILKELQKFLGPGQNIKPALLIGGDSMFKQLQQLRAKPRLIVGTPGRINDHLEQKTLDLRQTDFLVLDETDRMLDMGFEVQIERILSYMPSKRQTLLFSATLPGYIVKMSDKYLKSPERVAVGSTTAPVTKIEQELVQVKASDKPAVLQEQLAKRTGSVIIFVKTKHGADRLAKRLTDSGHTSEAIHGDLSQSRRNRVIMSFRNKEFRILVATDVAARGLDIPHIEHVINYDLPQVAEDYIHRIGRTGRAGAKGSAAVFIMPEDRQKWNDIHFLINPNEKNTLQFDDTPAKKGKKKSSSGSKARGTRAFAKEKAAKKQDSWYDKPAGAAPSAPRFERKERRDDDRPQRGFRSDDRPQRAPRDDRDGGFRKPRRADSNNRFSEGGDTRGKKSFGAKPRRDFGDFRKSDGEGRRERSDRDDRRGGSSFGDRKPTRRFDDDRPKRRFDDDKPKRRFDDDKPKRRFDGDKPKRSFDGDKRSKDGFGARAPFKSRRDGAGKAEGSGERSFGKRGTGKPASKKFTTEKKAPFGGAKRKPAGAGAKKRRY